MWVFFLHTDNESKRQRYRRVGKIISIGEKESTPWEPFGRVHIPSPSVPWVGRKEVFAVNMTRDTVWLDPAAQPALLASVKWDANTQTHTHTTRDLQSQWSTEQHVVRTYNPSHATYASVRLWMQPTERYYELIKRSIWDCRWQVVGCLAICPLSTGPVRGRLHGSASHIFYKMCLLAGACFFLGRV